MATDTNLNYYAIITSGSFLENDKILIKNTVESPFVQGTAMFQKETYITNIALYDKENNILGIASLSNPVRKTDNREFVFKLKIDF